MLLSDAYKKYEYMPATYACCVKCKTAWVDDMEPHTNLGCPKCGPEAGVMYRGAKDPQQYGCTVDLTEAEDKVKRAAEDATPKAYNIAEGKRNRI